MAAAARGLAALDTVLGTQVAAQVNINRAELDARAAAMGITPAHGEELVLCVALHGQVERRWVALAAQIKPAFASRLALMSKETEVKALIVLGMPVDKQLAYAAKVPRKKRGVDDNDDLKQRRDAHNAAKNALNQNWSRLLALCFPVPKVELSAAAKAAKRERGASVLLPRARARASDPFSHPTEEADDGESGMSSAGGFDEDEEDEEDEDEGGGGRPTREERMAARAGKATPYASDIEGEGGEPAGGGGGGASVLSFFSSGSSACAFALTPPPLTDPPPPQAARRRPRRRARRPRPRRA